MAQRDIWPAKEDFVEFDKVIKWRNLEKGIYRICKYKETNCSYGKAFILQLEIQAGKQFNVWAPQRLSDRLLEEDYNFKLNEGLAESTKTGREYSNSHCYLVNFRYDLQIDHSVFRLIRMQIPTFVLGTPSTCSRLISSLTSFVILCSYIPRKRQCRALEETRSSNPFPLTTTPSNRRSVKRRGAQRWPAL